MKCPSCGAETKGKFCEYCGSEMTQEKPNVGGCPKCGGNNVTFKRERVGTATQSRSQKNVIGKGRTGHSVSQSAYRTVGICQNCGYTWNPNGNNKSGKKTWLWVLGWICIFPVPLTILMLRKKDMKPAVKYGIIAAAWLLFFIIGSTGGGTDAPAPEATTPTAAIVEQTETVTTEAVPETTETVEQLETYYDRNETINLYVNRFNAVNPDAMIGADLCVVYYHHGSEHDDQIKFTRDDFEVVVTNSFSNNIKLVIDGSIEKTTDDYKLIFMQYARAYNADLTGEKLEEYWQAAFEDITNSPEFDEFDLSLQIWKDEIEYIIIEGKIQ